MSVLLSSTTQESLIFKVALVSAHVTVYSDRHAGAPNVTMCRTEDHLVPSGNCINESWIYRQICTKNGLLFMDVEELGYLVQVHVFLSVLYYLSCDWHTIENIP